MVGPVVAFQGWLAGVDVGGLSDAERVDLVGVLERVKGSVCAVQARATDAVRCSREVVAPVDAARSVGSVVALARRESPSAGDRLVGVARALVHEMPVTMAALAAGVISERHAVAVVAATACLSREDRGVVDARVGPVLPGVGVQGAAGAAGRVAAELDAAAVVARRAAAVASRRVTTRPAPDGMAYLCVLGPLKEVVGAYAAVRARARAVVSGQCPEEGPQGRGVGAVMADTALRVLSGRAVGEVTAVEVHLVITDMALFGVGDPKRSVNEPARIPGHGSVPAPIARAWLREDLPDTEDDDGGPDDAAARGGTVPDDHVPDEPVPNDPVPDEAPDDVPGVDDVVPDETESGEGTEDADGDVTPRQEPVPDEPVLDVLRDDADALHDDAEPGDAQCGEAGRDEVPEGAVVDEAVADPARAEATADGPAGAGADPAGAEATADGPAGGATARPRGGQPPGSPARGAPPPGRARPHPSAPPERSHPPTPGSAVGAGPGTRARKPEAGSRVARVWLRRLYTSPDGRDLVGMDSRRRTFSGLLRRMLVLRDDVCTTPWCQAPIVHADHAHPARAGGVTGYGNGDGRCARCNQVKEAPGWSVRVIDDGLPGRHRPRQVEVTTPTGHTYRSVAPPITGWGWEERPGPHIPRPAGDQDLGAEHSSIPATPAMESDARRSQRARDPERADTLRRPA
ncbi:hypothetical protein GCM10023168_00210 [Fodinibacter luteus]|uniref:DUF222 domain-containing protein n=1 Tax=Fodinibacter luteus TaxID=552064 RepID=A0ABP8JUW2_9MICO